MSTSSLQRANVEQLVAQDLKTFLKAYNKADEAKASKNKHEKSKETKPKSQNSLVVQDLLASRKEVLNKLWEDTDAGWMYRDTFLHKHFKGSFYENYKSISQETLRLLEARWLDLRIRGLIDQREISIHQILEHCNNEIYLDERKERIWNELEIFRSTSLYVVEYILTWLTKMTDRKCYLWKNTDYLIKMATDVENYFLKDAIMIQIIDELGLERTSCLLIPLNYKIEQDFTSPAKKQPGEPHSFRQFGSLISDAAEIENLLKETQPLVEEEEPIEVFLTEQLEREEQTRLMPAAARDNQHSFLNTPVTNRNLNPSRVLQQIQSPVPHKEDETANQSKLLSAIKTKTKKISLLVEQSFGDRNKQFKRYSEPLMSVRHEDLLEQNNLDFLHDLSSIKPHLSVTKVAKKEFERVDKVAKRNLKYTSKVLDKGKPVKKSDSVPQTEEEEAKALEATSVKDFEFQNRRAELERVQRADHFLKQNYLQTSN